MTTLGTLYTIRNQDSKWGQANIDQLFSFGEFTGIRDGASNFSVWELLLFILIGCLGGLIGACFNAGNEHLTIWRMKRINHSKKRRMVEVLVMSVLVTVVSSYADSSTYALMGAAAVLGRLARMTISLNYSNYPNQSFIKMSLFLALRWLPQFIVYCIDMSIWYSLWQAFAGTSVGFSDHLGDIRSMKDIRNSFGRDPEHFCSRCSPPMPDPVEDPQQASSAIPTSKMEPPQQA